MQTTNNRDYLYQSLLAGHIIITPNNRLSKQILASLTPNTTIDKPNCFPYQTFLQNCYKSLQHHDHQKKHPLLLNTQQERQLWLKILTPDFAPLINEIMAAWQYCQQWQVDINQELFQYTPATRQLQLWHQQLQQQLASINAICQTGLANYLINHPQFLPQNTIIWACFDDFTPEQKILQQVLEQQGCIQSYYDLAAQPHGGQYYPAPTATEEQNQLLLWLQQQLADKKQQIAVVVPDLHQQAATLKRFFDQHLPPESYDLSMGQELSAHPLVAHALTWLNLQPDVITNHQLRLLLHSPYLVGSQQEFYQRAALLEHQELHQEASLPSTNVQRIIASTAPQLANILQNLSIYPASATAQEWLEHFYNRLNQLGFPGEYSLQSESYQCYARFLTLGEEFRQLAVIHQEMTQEQALTIFSDLAQNVIFQPQVTQRPIQIMGLLEASGCVFDAIWVTGLTDQCLPSKTRLSSFIPIQLQRNLKMPHATPDREYQLSQQLIQRLQNSAPEVVFSYPQLKGDTPYLPSPLLTNPSLRAVGESPVAWLLATREPTKFPGCKQPGYTSSPTARNDGDKPKSNLLSRQENYQIPLATEETLTGGTTLLANQAKCPFRAFAAHRLHTKSSPTTGVGLSDAERGQIIHKVMEQLWQNISTQQQLLTLTEEKLNNYCTTAITNALTPFIKQHPHSLPPLVQEVEKNRLLRIVKQCLTWEKTRPPFTISALEQKYKFNLAEINIDVRVDRLDQTDDDTKVVIDYKSNFPPTKPWQETRPEAPQLLLYALLDPTINALLLLKLKTGQVEASGISASEQSILGVKQISKDETWTTKQQQWLEQLTTLANELKTGHCPPIPQHQTTCQQCEFNDLCRK